jgi:septal ring factor EnvC (AmiA/AmiB activator)
MQKSRAVRQLDRSSVRRSLLLCGGAAFVLALAEEAVAQDGANVTKSGELSRLEAEIESGLARLDALSAEAERLDADAASLRVQLVEAAAGVQEWEIRLNGVEARLFALLSREHDLLERLKGRRATIAELLGALESLEINRPPALGVTPDDAMSAARSAMLLSALIPAVKEETDALERELRSLQALRGQIREEQHDVVVTAQALADKKGALEKLLSDMAARREALMRSAEAEQARLNLLAAQAKDLRSLLDALAQGKALGALPRQKPSAVTVASAALLPEARSFATLRGKLKRPVVGEINQTFRAETASRTKNRGLVFATRADAQVISPCDGTIAFAGSYLDYGLLLIIAAGDGYHVLLAGMSRIDGVVGQRLLAGEPIGKMGGNPEAPSEAPPELYVEIRRNGEPIDPLPWLAESDRKVSG